jgi:glycosyltransferase involved in cell wall biosynthesis
MRAAGCLVLPSRFEPWGVVVHEATIAGLPVITTEACGAARRLVFDGHNGRVIAAGDDEALADALVEHTSSTPEQRRRQSARSQQLSVQMSPDRWVETLVTGTNRALAARPS